MQDTCPITQRMVDPDEFATSDSMAPTALGFPSILPGRLSADGAKLDAVAGNGAKPIAIFGQCTEGEPFFGAFNGACPVSYTPYPE